MKLYGEFYDVRSSVIWIMHNNNSLCNGGWAYKLKVVSIYQMTTILINLTSILFLQDGYLSGNWKTVARKRV